MITIELDKDDDQKSDLKTNQYDHELKMAAEIFAKLTVPDDWEQLPVDSNFMCPLLRHYRCRGTVMTSFHLMNGSRQHLERFQARPSDIIVASFPKSGTTWLQEIVWRVVHGDTPLTFRSPPLEFPPSNLMSFRPLEDVPEPRLIMSHLPHQLLPESVRSSGAKVLYVSRDARDVCVSYYHWIGMLNFYMYRGTFQELRDRFINGTGFPGPYREHVKGYLDHADTILCLTYEELYSKRAGVIRKIAAFLGRTLTDADVEGIVTNTSFADKKSVLTAQVRVLSILMHLSAS